VYAYLGREGVYDLGCEGLSELEEEENGELPPWKRCLDGSDGEERCFLVDGGRGHERREVTYPDPGDWARLLCCNPFIHEWSVHSGAETRVATELCIQSKSSGNILLCRCVSHEYLPFRFSQSKRSQSPPIHPGHRCSVNILPSNAPSAHPLF
jgi:hypothetical protein